METSVYKLIDHQIREQHESLVSRKMNGIDVDTLRAFVIMTSNVLGDMIVDSQARELISDAEAQLLDAKLYEEIDSFYLLYD